MKAFTNVFGTKIEHKPFYQTVLKTWRVARFENGELEQVYEGVGFKTKEKCLQDCQYLQNRFLELK